MNEDPPAADVLRGRSPQDLSHDVTSFDSAVVFLIKSLFYPVTAVAFFALCLWAGTRPVTGSDYLIAILTFAGAAELLGDSRIDFNAPVQQDFRWFLDIFVRWMGICACIALVLNLPLNTVRTHLHRGRQKLKQRLREGLAVCQETR